ncbi:5-formyltetrahydrofolate cyclo-ligase [Desertivirga xinjiangensis]|uniref:5-formyltetrahydrofolate cyclo-ligase n=1 Tax=Desertivirga xinjiangensis TaxID=539206 RepID=UPI00210B11F7
MNKSLLRKQYLQKRSDLSTQEAGHLSDAVLNYFSSLDFSRVRYLHAFYPIVGKHEFNSLLLVDWLREKHPEIKILLPKSDIKAHTLVHIVWNEHTALAMNEWGITEPEYGEEMEPSRIDAVIVPLLAFDKKGNRIGYGKGFYDRFLSECRSETIKIGVSLFEPEEKIEDTDEHDIPLDICITPYRIWRFNNYI